MQRDTPTASSPTPQSGEAAGEPSFVLVSRIALETRQIIFRKLADGSRADCDRIADDIPAVAWKGSVKAVQADLITMPASDWREISDGNEVVSATLDAAAGPARTGVA